MKGTLYSIKGEKKSEINLPELFDITIRPDVALKFFEADKFTHMQHYSHDPMAGRKHSASGTISHRRHEWKGHYGKGIARVPRKAMYRRGVSFFWVGAEVTSTRGGRRVHGPKVNRVRKINRNEVQLAMNSGFASTASKDLIMKRYSSLEGKKINLNFPIVVESKLDKIKAKDLISFFNTVFGDLSYLVLQNREVRAGKGKGRGRKYKSNAGLLLVKAKDENIKLSGLDIKSVGDLCIEDLYPLGRLTIYTEKALKELAEGTKEAKK
jgi:large subunit ribosomal protein L4e